METDGTASPATNVVEALPPVRSRRPRRARRRNERAVHTDAEFHFAVVRCAHNTLLAELYRGLAEVVAGSVAATLAPDMHKWDQISHAGLVEAIAEQDVERAGREAGDFLARLLNEHWPRLPGSASEHRRISRPSSFGTLESRYARHCPRPR